MPKETNHVFLLMLLPCTYQYIHWKCHRRKRKVRVTHSLFLFLSFFSVLSYSWIRQREQVLLKWVQIKKGNKKSCVSCGQYFHCFKNKKHMHTPVTDHKLCNVSDSTCTLTVLIIAIKTATVQHRYKWKNSSIM